MFGKFKSKITCQLHVQLVGEYCSHGHKFLGFVSGIAKHQALIPCAYFLIGFILVDTLSNVGALLLNGCQHSTRFVIKT